MKEFKIFHYPEGRQEAVKQGWSWPGFFFGPGGAAASALVATGTGSGKTESR